MLNCFHFNPLTKLKPTKITKRTLYRLSTISNWFSYKTSWNSCSRNCKVTQQIKTSKLCFNKNSNNGNNCGNYTNTTSSNFRFKNSKIVSSSIVWRHLNSELWHPKCSFRSWSLMVVTNSNQCRKVWVNKEKLILNNLQKGKHREKHAPKEKLSKIYAATQSSLRTSHPRNFCCARFGFTSVSLAWLLKLWLMKENKRAQFISKRCKMRHKQLQVRNLLWATKISK